LIRHTGASSTGRYDHGTIRTIVLEAEATGQAATKVRRDELAELYYITSIQNVPSILVRGLLSHNLAKSVPHVSVAGEEFQERRRRKQVPGGRPVHDYANLYINARNPMMSRRRDLHATVCVLRVSPLVLDVPSVVVTTQNVTSDYVRFFAAPDGLARIDRATVFAESWKHPDDQIAEWRHTSAMCAEVLVPDRVAPEMIVGAYVSGDAGLRALAAVAPDLPAVVNSHLFLQ
jgi:hypothetical protein